MMKKYIVLIAIILGGMITLTPASTQARVLGGQDKSEVKIAADQTIDDDLYVAGRTIIIDGTINGDVYAAGSRVVINGHVLGDVFAAGSEVALGGTVDGSARLAAGNIKLDNAQIGGSLSAFGSDINVSNSSSIGGGLNLAGGNVVVGAPIARGAMVGASKFRLDGSLGKDLVIGAAVAELGGQSKVGGDVVYFGDTKLDQQSGSQVTGQVKHRDTPTRNGAASGVGRAWIWSTIWGLLALYATGAMLLWLFPRQTKNVAEVVSGRFWPSAATGSIAILVALPAFILLLLTLIGIPLAIISFIVLIIAGYLAKFFVGLSLGGYIARKIEWKPNPYGDALIGVIFITILELLPIIGWVVSILVLVAGIGGLLLAFAPGGGKTKPAPAVITAKSKPKAKTTKR